VSAPEDFGAVMAAWAARTPAVDALVLIGSRERDGDDAVWRADAHSDWYFQIILLLLWHLLQLVLIFHIQFFYSLLEI
jgi:hypothetical protein